MEEEKNKTEADFQIERLKKLKQEKEEKIKKVMIDAIDFTRVSEKIKVSKPKQPRHILIEKEIYEKIHKILSDINKNKLSGKISKNKFINKILKDALFYLEKEKIDDLTDINKIFKNS